MTDTSTLLCKKVEPTNSGALVKDSAHPFIEVPSLNSALTEVTYSLGVMDVLQGSPTASVFFGNKHPKTRLVQFATCKKLGPGFLHSGMPSGRKGAR